jgi:LysR family transcriptional regulator, glycine cleavage system transcriptional activator
MHPLIPSTTALRVFEAAARHGSFTEAAEELFLTQSAVSKQIKSLEDALGVALFVRINRGLVLTELGRWYLDDVRPALQQLEAATVKLATRRASRTTLTLRIVAIVGDRWLLPRFSRFAQAHPELDVQFTSLLSRDGQDQAQADGEFRFGEGSWPGCAADYLFGRELLLVAAPALLAKLGNLQQAWEVLRFPLLQHFQVPHAWQEFFDAHGVVPETAPQIVRYEFYSTIIGAAVNGMGLALVPRVFLLDELQRGTLVNPMAAGVIGRSGYYFVFPQHKQADPALAALRAWLIEEAQADAQADDGRVHWAKVPSDRNIVSST